MKIFYGILDTITVLVAALIIWANLVVTGEYLDAIMQLIFFEVYLMVRKELKDEY
jgi:hypothetical protein